MEEKHNENEIWKLVGYIKISKTRQDTLKTLQTSYLMPSEISKITGYRIPQISNALHDLKEKKLVECMNEDAHKGRIYRNTELGLTVLEMLNK
ncbi:MarR family transcriptional regulator [Methanobrevibacter sp.]